MTSIDKTPMPPTSPSSTNKITKQKEGIALVVSAPSGAGKTTICHRLIEKLADLKINTSHTTRPPRENEVDGKDYFFVSEEKFIEMKENREFLEWASINNNFYGTALDSINKIRASGQDILLELDVQGADSLRKLSFPGIYVFILPPSLEELASRLNKRGTESEEIIQQRLEMGIREIKGCLEYDYIFTNHEVEESVDNIISIFNAERLKASRFTPESTDIQELLNSQRRSDG
jgi:guanylate kinase